MRASHFALIAAVLAIPSAAYSQDRGLVDSRVGPDLSTSTTQPSLSMGSTGAFRRPPELGPRAGFAGVTMPGQILPQNVPIMPRPGGDGTAWVNGHQVLVGPNSNRIVRVIR
jgi:hypothetical protein